MQKQLTSIKKKKAILYGISTLYCELFQYRRVFLCTYVLCLNFLKHFAPLPGTSKVVCKAEIPCD